MEVSIEERDGYAEVVVEGRLNVAGASQLRAKVADAIADGHRLLVMNLRKTEFMDSSGLGALVGCLKAAREAGGDLRLAQVGERVGAVLKLTSLDRVFVPHENAEDAAKGE
ncbi:STAS domain-containing protein [Sinomonas sp. JGH33]|uniref:Anti-sigma factor antagonist n=1 Tax=Sinomonas terricola TaxID=3110330 RepID=A0ABU5T7T7_9MICC|nr:STAS domain-containing protein [Sinomonas sp. JGH33]MEA5455151.1 STAS domain-containing protein [Sinomonas sp. JGH33]